MTGGVTEVYGRHVEAVDGYEPVLVLDESYPEAIMVPAIYHYVKAEL